MQKNKILTLLLGTLFVMYLAIDDNTEAKKNIMWAIKNNPSSLYYLIILFLVAFLTNLLFAKLKENHVVETWLNKLTQLHINKWLIIISAIILLAMVAMVFYFSMTENESISSINYINKSY